MPEPGSTPIRITPAVRHLRLEDACAVEYPRLVRLLTLYCGDRETALDLAQEACTRGCAEWSSVRRMDDQRAWFTRVALNLARGLATLRIHLGSGFDTGGDHV